MDGHPPAVPHGLEEIVRAFGDCRSPGFARGSLATFDLPYPLVYGTAMVQRATGHHLLVPVFQAVLSELKFEGLMERATHTGGIYAFRPIRGQTQHLSTHSWGIAIDINPQENQLGTTGHMDRRVIAVFEKHGFVWGGGFHRKDPMHFQYATGY